MEINTADLHADLLNASRIYADLKMYGYILKIREMIRDRPSESEAAKIRV